VRIVVTGATGNIGTSLLDALARLDDPPDVVGVARRRPSWSLPNVTWVEADISSDELTEPFRGADVVVHLAWLIAPSHDPWTMWNTNVVGTERVFRATAGVGAGALVHMSSVGAYSPAPRDHEIDEHWPTDGIPTLEYSWQKAYCERLLDRFETEHPQVRVARLRPALVFKSTAGPEVQRLFLGPLVPGRLLRPSMASAIARIAPLRFQAVHSADVGNALLRVARNDHASGAFNLAADSVLGRDVAMGARAVRAASAVAWHLRLSPGAPGWIDLAARVPLMSSDRARRELGWYPEWSTQDALADLLRGLHERQGGPTPPLAA